MLHQPKQRPLAALLACLAATATGAQAQLSPCEQQARFAHSSATLEAQSDLLEGLAVALNLVDPLEYSEAVLDAYVEYFDSLDLAADQYKARLAVCARVGYGPYAPEIDPQDFVAVVDNPLFPLLPGAQRSLRKVTGGGDIETVDTTVLNVTRQIMGVQCTVLHVFERENGTLVEETFDYYAQDVDGNVWYFGELAMNFEGGYLRDLDGSWIAGEDGAQPGILVPGTPVAGDTYRQEFLLDEAEDLATVTALGVLIQVPYGSLTGCMTTFDFTPLQPDHREMKAYAPGIGLVLEVDLVSGERMELISAQ